MQTVLPGKAAEPFRLAAQFSEGCGGDRGRRCGSQSVRAATRRSGRGIRPLDSGRPGRRYVIRGGSVMSLDSKVGDFPQADVLVEGKKILAVGPNLQAGGAAEIDATGRIVMPGFIDTHHHQFETALRSFLADGVLINDKSGTAAGTHHLLRIHSPHLRPGVPAAGRVHQRAVRRASASSTTASRPCTTSRKSITRRSTPTPPSRRCSTRGAASPSAISRARGATAPTMPIRRTPSASNSSTSPRRDQLVTMIMGGEVYLGTPIYTQSWTIGRQLGLQIAAHILSPFGITSDPEPARHRPRRRQ